VRAEDTARADELTMFAVSISPPLGAWNTFIGIAIAFLKAGLVAMLFMELSRSRTLIRLAGASGLTFLFILLD